MEFLKRHGFVILSYKKSHEFFLWFFKISWFFSNFWHFFGFWNVYNFSKDGRRKLADLSFYSEFCALQGGIVEKRFISRFRVPENHDILYFHSSSMVSADETFTESALDAALSWLLGSLVKNFPALNFIDKKSTTKLYG